MNSVVAANVENQNSTARVMPIIQVDELVIRLPEVPHGVCPAGSSFFNPVFALGGRNFRGTMGLRDRDNGEIALPLDAEGTVCVVPGRRYQVVLIHESSTSGRNAVAGPLQGRDAGAQYSHAEVRLSAVSATVDTSKLTLSGPHTTTTTNGTSNHPQPLSKRAQKLLRRQQQQQAAPLCEDTTTADAVAEAPQPALSKRTVKQQRKQQQPAAEAEVPPFSEQFSTPPVTEPKTRRSPDVTPLIQLTHGTVAVEHQGAAEKRPRSLRSPTPKATASAAVVEDDAPLFTQFADESTLPPAKKPRGRPAERPQWRSPTAPAEENPTTLADTRPPSARNTSLKRRQLPLDSSSDSD